MREPPLISSLQPGEVSSEPRGYRRWLLALCLICGVLITVQAWSERLTMNPDGISYLDMADRLLQGDPRPLAHPYWSPLYPCLLGLILKLCSATPASEFAVVHLVNWLIGLTSLASFTFFIVQFGGSEKRNREDLKENSLTDFRLRTGFAYALFLGASVDLISIGLVTPDLCVAALVYLAAGLCYRIIGSGSLLTSILVGVVLGLAYFAKAAMMPLGGFLIVVLFFRGTLRRKSLVVASALGFLITVGPLIIVLSRNEKHVTIGESGRFNYAKLVQGASGLPVHPPRLVSRNPLVFGFESSSGYAAETYPPHYNPVIYFDGLHVGFDLRKQFRALLNSIYAVAELHGMFPLLAGLMALCFVALRDRRGLAGNHLWVIFWSLGAFVMYSLVVVLPRYIAPFGVLFWLAIYESVVPRQLRPEQRAIFGTIALCLSLPLVWVSITQIREANRPSSDIVAARNVAGMGIRQGERIAIIGNYYRASYVARLARLRIVAQVPDQNAFARFWVFPEEPAVDRFWAMNDDQLRRLEEAFRQLGITAVMALDARCPIGTGWHSLGSPTDCVLLLR